MTLGEIIKNYRAEHDMSMDDFVKASGLSKAYISMLENNRNPKTNRPIIPSIDTYNKAAKGMRMNVTDLINCIAPMRVQSVVDEQKAIGENPPALFAYERQLLDSFNELSTERQIQVQTFIRYLLNEQNKEKGTTSTMA